MNRFSKRHGHTLVERPITIREDAPSALRDYVIQLIYDLKKYYPSFLRRIICRVLRVSPDSSNWSEFPNIESEVYTLIHGCEWYFVYDIIEAFWENIDAECREEFSNELNDYFRYNGIGWKLEFGLIEARGDETFEKSITSITAVLEGAKLQTALSEIKEALNDLSRRPNADITGAIQHSLACLECVCREITRDKKATLGELIKKFPGIVPKPLDAAIEKIWGFTSEQGRHLREGNAPNYLEAELVVELTAAIASYLGKKLGGSHKEAPEDDLPF